MKLTNKFNYPEAVELAIKNDPYSRGDSEFTPTSLNEPPRITQLKKQHDSELVLDVDDRIFILYGQIGHLVLERANKNNLVEKRFFGVIDGHKISAQIDSLCLDDEGTLMDYKFTTVYGFKKGTEPKGEWCLQMNIQLELLRQNGMDAKRLRVCGLLRDWRPGEAKKEKGYPNKIAYHEIPIMPREDVVKMVSEMIKAHKDAEKVLPECTPSQTWNTNRCRGYCDVSKFCDQWKKTKSSGIQ